MSTATISGRSTPLYAEPRPSRPMIARVVSHKNTGTTTAAHVFSQVSGNVSGPLPAELITRRSTNSIAVSKESNETSHNRVSSGAGSFPVQKPVVFTYDQMTKTNTPTVRVSTPLHIATRSLDTGLNGLDGPASNGATVYQYSDRSRVRRKSIAFDYD